MACDNSDIRNHIINIKTFKNYIEKVIESIENQDTINEDHIITLSKTITCYYRELHSNDSSDDEIEIELLDNSSNDTSEMELDDKNKCENNSESDDDIDSFCLIESLKKKEEKKEEKKDNFLDQFINNNIDNSNILLYKKDNNVSNKLNNFLENCIEY